MCEASGEIVDHLLLHYPVAYEMWTTIFSMFRVQWVMLSKVLALLACWQGQFRWHQSIEIWKTIPHCLMWCLWRERNSRLLEDCEMNILDLRFLRTLLD